MSSDGPARWPHGYGLLRLKETDSTNQEAARQAGSAPGPTWIVADRQTKGRGRRGRAWSSPDGALLTTLLLRPDEDPATAALRSFVTSVALADAFDSVGVPADAIGLKWPNDVLLHGCKVAGILLESSGDAGRLSHLAIGIGINLTGEPDLSLVELGASPPITLAQVLGRPVDRDDMLIALAAAYAHREAQFSDYGFGPIREAWLARAARLGDVITARTLNDSHEGTFETVDPDGSLRLRTAHGHMVITAADVFFHT
ncbi:MAG: biotin--[acetyl-CoA-carboxylase] ligase [Pseudomonadota bacterium]